MDKMKNASKRPNEMGKSKKHTEEPSEAKENDSKFEHPKEESSSKSEVEESKLEMSKEDSPDVKSTTKNPSVPLESETKEEKIEAAQVKIEEKGENLHEAECKAEVSPPEEAKESKLLAHEIPEELKEEAKETSAEVHSDEAKVEESAKEIEFSIEYFTNFGEKLVVVGSTPELGAWDEKAGLALQWNEPNIWKGKTKIGNFPVEYKYLVTNENTCNWEDGQNRTLTADLESVRDCWQLA